MSDRGEVLEEAETAWVPHGRKYALLIIPLSPEDEGSQDLIVPFRTWRGRVVDLVDAKAVDHWRRWLGSMWWERVVEREHRLVLVTRPSERPSVTDEVNKQLSGDLCLVWQARLLTPSPEPFSGECWIISGRIDDTETHLLDMRVLEPLRAIARPFYATREFFYANREWHTMRPCRENEPDWIEKWFSLAAELHRSHRRLPDLIRMAVLSFEQAHFHEEIEFRIPGFVRAAEAILAIPKRRPGAETFSERCLKLLPGLRNHPMLGVPDLGAKLKSLYQHRNDCVHGKLPFPDLRTDGERGADEAAWFELLAEVIARDALLAALRSPDIQEAASTRENLERAWESGVVGA